jgi:hypothetical protein
MGAKLFDNPMDNEVLALTISCCSPDDALVLECLPGPRSPTNKAGINETIPGPTREAIRIEQL